MKGKQFDAYFIGKLIRVLFITTVCGITGLMILWWLFGLLLEYAPWVAIPLAAIILPIITPKKRERSD